MRRVCLLAVVLCVGCSSQPLTSEALHEQGGEKLNQFKNAALGLKNPRHAYNALEANRALVAEWQRRRQEDAGQADKWLLGFIEGKDPIEITEAVFGPGSADLEVSPMPSTPRTPVWISRPEGDP